MGDNPNMIDQLFAIGFLAFMVAIIILMKDIIDGGTFAPSERRTALLGFGLAGLLVASVLVMSMVSTDTVQPELYDDSFEVAYSGLASTSYTQAGNSFVYGVAGGTPANPSTAISFNMTTWSLDVLEKFRGITLNFSQSGITAAYLKYAGSTIFDSTSNPDTIQVNNGNQININLTDVQSLLIYNLLDYTTSNVLMITFAYDMASYKYDQSTAVDVILTETNKSELANFLIWAVMSFALFIPLMIYLDAFNNIRRFVNNPLGNNRRRMRRMRR